LTEKQGSIGGLANKLMDNKKLENRVQLVDWPTGLIENRLIGKKGSIGDHGEPRIGELDNRSI
jgi:hypothetical protein